MKGKNGRTLSISKYISSFTNEWMLNRGDFPTPNFENKSLHNLETQLLLRLQTYEPEIFPWALQCSRQLNGLTFFCPKVLQN